MKILAEQTGRLGYTNIVKEVLAHGTKRSPRGQLTYDLGPTTIVYVTPYDALPVGTNRKLNVAIAAGEAVQLVAGRARHDLMSNITARFLEFQEVNGKFWGAYGDRIGQQMFDVVDKLHKDRNTRQAVVTLWKPGLDNVPGKKDYPCTVALNFAIVDDWLEMRTLMRSNDVWWGLPYDVFQFTQLQLTLARVLDVAPGRYTHTTWSLHLYDRHAFLADSLIQASDESIIHNYPQGFGRDRISWNQTTIRAARIMHGESADIEPTESEQWYGTVLSPYVG